MENLTVIDKQNVAPEQPVQFERFDSGVRYPSDFSDEEIAAIRPLVVELIAKDGWTPEQLEMEGKYHDLLRYVNDQATPGTVALLMRSPDFKPATSQTVGFEGVRASIVDTAKHIVAAVVKK